ncbi:MAG: hypothetical protein WC284_12210 [Candidimonas sp.]
MRKIINTTDTVYDRAWIDHDGDFVSIVAYKGNVVISVKRLRLVHLRNFLKMFGFTDCEL